MVRKYWCAFLVLVVLAMACSAPASAPSTPAAAATSAPARTSAPAGTTAPAAATTPAAAGATSAPAATAAVTRPTFTTVEPGYLTVAFTDGLLPKIALKDGGLEGYEGYLFTKVAERYGLKLKPAPTTFSGELLAVQQGKADVGSSMYYTADRSKQFYYTQPHIYDLTGWIMKKSDTYTGPDSLKGKRVGTQEGYVYVAYMRTTYGEGNVKLYQNIAAGYNDVKNGQIDAYMAGTGSGSRVVKDDPTLVLNLLKPGDLGMPESVLRAANYQIVNCNNKQLAEAINAVLPEILKSPEWKTITASYNVDKPEFSPALESPAQGC